MCVCSGRGPRAGGGRLAISLHTLEQVTIFFLLKNARDGLLGTYFYSSQNNGVVE